jgi:membrane protein involved in colicin uptake
MERIRVEVVWDAEDGTLDDLENEGGDVTMVKAALAAAEEYREGGTSYVAVDAYREEA